MAYHKFNTPNLTLCPTTKPADRFKNRPRPLAINHKFEPKHKQSVRTPHQKETFFRTLTLTVSRTVILTHMRKVAKLPVRKYNWTISMGRSMIVKWNKDIEKAIQRQTITQWCKNKFISTIETRNWWSLRSVSRSIVWTFRAIGSNSPKSGGTISPQSAAFSLLKPAHSSQTLQLCPLYPKKSNLFRINSVFQIIHP